MGVRRICEDEVEGAGNGVSGFEEAEGVGSPDASAFEPGLGQIPSDHIAGPPVLIHEKRRGSSPAEGLKSEGAGACKQFEYAGVNGDVAEHREDGLSDPILSGAGDGFGDFEREAARLTSNEAHAKVLARIGFPCNYCLCVLPENVCLSAVAMDRRWL